MKLYRSHRQKSIGIVIGILILIGAILYSSTGFIVNYQWFSEVGYTEVFLKGIVTKLKLGIPLFIILTLILYIYFALLKALYNKNMMVFGSKEQNRRENRWVLAGSAILSLILSSIITFTIWYDLLEFLHATPFNISDPIFSRDMSFYIFKLPLFEQLYSVGLTALVFFAIASFVFFILMFSLKGKQGIFPEDDQPHMDIKRLSQQFLSLGSKQFSILAATFFILLSFGYYLRTFSILYTPAGVVFGAGYIDIHINLWMYRVLMAIAWASAILVIFAGYKKRWKLALAGPAALIIVTLIGNIIAIGMDNFIVSPNEMVKERPYIQNHINYTQAAYDLTDIEEKEFPVEQNLTAESLKNNEITINNIPINDYRPTLSMYNSLQGFRRYYEFNDVDIDRYMIDGEYTQVFLSARELDQNNIDEDSRNWINQHLIYTHGFGATVSPVKRVNHVGQPELLLKDIPPQGSKDLEITQPRIYFGELTDDYVITNTRTKEFDYPSGDDNVEYLYEGDAGIPLNFLNRILFAINKGTLRFILSNDISSESRILIHRNIMERVQKIAPFLSYDEDPYLVIHEGKLYWIIDAFTTSNRYAYSQPVSQGSFNYIRNSIKVVIDAFNGEVTFYQVDRKDPIASTYGKIYPNLLKDINEMPEGLRSHIRYSQTMFDIQSEIYRTYHVDNPNVFYNGEDVWQISKQIYGREEEPIESTYIIMKEPDGEEEEFVLMVPYTPREKDNMISWMAALNDGDNYGKLLIYKFPKEKLVYGPMQIEKRIDQDAYISKELTLLDQQGSTVIRGNLLTIPVDNSLLFVEPIYLESSGGERNLPEVKRVIVAYENDIVMAESLEEGLNQIFGEVEDQEGDPEDQEPGEWTGVRPKDRMDDLILEANQLFEKAQEAQRQGDWAAYGDYIDQLRDVLRDLEESVGVRPSSLEGAEELESTPVEELTQ